MRSLLTVLFTLACLPSATRELTGAVHSYEVAAGDTLTSIGARFGIEPGTLAKNNGLHPANPIHPGALLTIDNRHIAPAPRASGIVVNIAQRMLFVFKDGAVVRGFPVAVGRPDWRTPRGEFEIAVKEIDPTWDVPRSIQDEMVRLRRPVLTQVRPGPDNPLGNRWLGLSAPGVGIHGTNAPASIYRFATHGCIRVQDDDMQQLFDLVSVGTSVELIYEPLLATRVQSTTFIEVHRDVYRLASAPDRDIVERLRALGVEHLSGSDAVRLALADQAGQAVIVDPGRD